MTANLISYWKNAEDKRHNLATESETFRHNLAVEEYNRGVLEETARHNLAYEAETHRANLAREIETVRSNMAYEAEVHRHNVVVETETERSNRASEAIKRESNSIGWANVQLGYAQLAELERHNRRTELTDYTVKMGSLAESIRHNKATETETNRHNTQDERHRAVDTTLSHMQWLGDYSNDRAEVKVKQQSAAEEHRHNLESEGVAWYDADTRRSSAESQNLKNIASAAGSIVHGAAELGSLWIMGR